MKSNVALVHDFLLNFGGAEAVLKNMGELYPDAPIYVLMSNEDNARKWLGKKEIINSFLQKMPKFFKQRHKFLLPLMPTAPETFNLRDFDLVLSSSSGFAKGIIVKPRTMHICYMHAPMRYVWDWSHKYLDEQQLGGKAKLLTRMILSYLRMWDRASAERVDYFLANSQYTADRIRKYYNKTATVIYPPVEVNKFKPQKENQGYFLTVARLSPYKQVKLIIEAFNKLKLPLIIVGEGSQRQILEKEIGTNSQIKLLGWVEEAKKIELYQNARAFVYACEDDFGIAPVEAMAAGKPVIAYGQGGVAETVVDGQTGLFFHRPQVEMLADGIRRFIETEDQFDHLVIRKRAEEFSKERFLKEMKEFIAKVNL